MINPSIPCNEMSDALFANISTISDFISARYKHVILVFQH